MEKELIVKIPGAQLRAACECKATDDVRWYLNGVCISTHGDLVGTNGHMMYVVPLEFENGPPKREYIFIPPKSLSSCTEVEIYAENDKQVRLNIFSKSRECSTHICDLLEGKFPDYKAVIPDSKVTFVPYEIFGFNAAYLAKLGKVFGAKIPLKFEMKNRDSAAKVTASNQTNGTAGIVVLMPVLVEPRQK